MMHGSLFRAISSGYASPKTFIVSTNLEEQQSRREINSACANRFLYFCRCRFDCNRMPHQSIETTDEDSVKLVDFLDAEFISCFCGNNTVYVHEVFVNTITKCWQFLKHFLDFLSEFGISQEIGASM